MVLSASRFLQGNGVWLLYRVQVLGKARGRGGSPQRKVRQR